MGIKVMKKELGEARKMESQVTQYSMGYRRPRRKY